MNRAENDLPSFLPFSLRKRLHDSNALTEKLDNESLFYFELFLEKAGKDTSWLLNHPEQSKQLLGRAITFIQSDKIPYEERVKIISILADVILNFKNVPALSNDTCFVFNSQKEIHLSSFNLTQQSDWAKMLLNHRSINGDVIIEAAKEKEDFETIPSFVKMRLMGLSEFNLHASQETSLDEFKKLLDYSRADQTQEYRTIDLLVEQELIKRINYENAFDLYHLAADYQMPQLQIEAIRYIDPKIEEETFEELFSQLAGMNSDRLEFLQRCCINYLIDHLHEKFIILGEWPLTKPASELTAEKHQALAFIQKFETLAPLVNRVESQNLHKLQPNVLDWVLSKLSDRLEEIDINQISWRDLSKLKRFSALKTLHCECCQNLTSIAAIKFFPKLEELHMDGCVKVSSLNPICQTPHLKLLVCVDCPKIMDLKAVQMHQNLNNLNIICEDKWHDVLLNISLSRKPYSGEFFTKENNIIKFQFFN